MHRSSHILDRFFIFKKQTHHKTVQLHASSRRVQKFVYGIAVFEHNIGFEIHTGTRVPAFHPKRATTCSTTVKVMPIPGATLAIRIRHPRHSGNRPSSLATVAIQLNMPVYLRFAPVSTCAISLVLATSKGLFVSGPKKKDMNKQGQWWERGQQ